MEINEYQRKAARTLLDRPDVPLSEGETMIIWNAIGLGGEAGEVLEEIKKGIFHRHGLSIDKLKKELGDVLWYTAAICTKVGLTLEEVMEANIEKLEKAYPTGYNSDDSKKKAAQQNNSLAEKNFWVPQTEAAALTRRKELNLELGMAGPSREEVDKAIKRLGEIHLDSVKSVPEVGWPNPSRERAEQIVGELKAAYMDLIKKREENGRTFDHETGGKNAGSIHPESQPDAQ